ncbi:MAG: hypothetical protein MHM6MM_008492 [Cercozoa sp. M6MM]
MLRWLLALATLQYVVGRHTSNWAVLVCTSRYWFNYRHVANTLAVYHILREQGVPDSQIILMLADDMPCNPRNDAPGAVFASPDRLTNLYHRDVEVDYRGDEVTVENVLRVLTGRHPANTPARKRLDTDGNANVLLYMTGHGGEEFLKFHDKEELQSADLAHALTQMKHYQRFRELLFVADTCQAESLYRQFSVPGVVAIGSSRTGENSYSYKHDDGLGLSVVDRFTSFSLRFFERSGGDASIQQWVDSLTFSNLKSHVSHQSTLTRPLSQVPLSDFFAATSEMHLLPTPEANDGDVEDDDFDLAAVSATLSQ